MKINRSTDIINFCIIGKPYFFFKAVTVFFMKLNYSEFYPNCPPFYIET